MTKSKKKQQHWKRLHVLMIMRSKNFTEWDWVKRLILRCIGKERHVTPSSVASEILHPESKQKSNARLVLPHYYFQS